MVPKLQKIQVFNFFFENIICCLVIIHFVFYHSIFLSIILGQRSTKIIAPPASLTSDMHERKASAQDCEIQIVRIFWRKNIKCFFEKIICKKMGFFQISPIRQVHAVSPDESSMGKKFKYIPTSTTNILDIYRYFANSKFDYHKN